MSATLAAFVDGGLPSDVTAALARIRAAPDVVHVAVMPDVHLAEDVCVGTVVATTTRLYPAAVGGDIGCGMLALAFDVGAEALDLRRAARVLHAMNQRIPRDRHRSGAAPPWPDALDPGRLSTPPLTALARHEGRLQLGTLGSGNHFVELQRDEEDRLWLMLHSGSRAVGPAIRAQNESGSGLTSLVADTGEGRAYLGDVEWALAFADENRRCLAEVVIDILGGELGAAPLEATRIACHHNHVRREQHGDRSLWVHRKGAIPAARGQPGVIPGSMGSASFHVEGRGLADALGSAAHGAGRRMSRSEARRRISARALGEQLGGVYWDHRRAEVLRDEAPAAYKDIARVMRAQHDLVRVVRRLTPVLAYKGA